MLRRQAIWIPTMKYFPLFADGFHAFLDNNPVTQLNFTKIGMRPENSYVALIKETKHGYSQNNDDNSSKNNSEENKVAALLAFPLTVSPDVCDYNPITQRLTLPSGFATGICDSTNSIHVMLRLLPSIPWHVSVNLQTQVNCDIEADSKIVLISCIDKIGKRLAFCTTQAYFDVDESTNDTNANSFLTPELIAKEKSIDNIFDLLECLKCYKQCITGAHVKAIIENRTKEDKLPVKQ